MPTSRARIAWLLLATCTLLGNAPAAIPSLDRLVAARRAVEAVSWRHRIWPGANPGPKPALDAFMSDAALRAKVTDGLRKSAALEKYWGRPITPGQLQAEMDRMAAGSRSPEILRELFAALGNDPALIAETLARPALADRVIRNAYALDDRMHGATRIRAEKAIARTGDLESLVRTGGERTEATWVRAGARGAGRSEPGPEPETILLESGEWNRRLESLAAAFGTGPDAVHDPARLPSGRFSGLQQDADRFYVSEIREAAEDRIVVVSVSWRKRSFDEWWGTTRDTLPARMEEKQGPYRLPEIRQTACDDLWSGMVRPDPEGREAHSLVWTGTEMIVWGGKNGSGAMTTGNRYNPATDTWIPTPFDEIPAGRAFHSAVWTGSEMIVWGGFSGTIRNDGGRYDPATDTWTSTRLDDTTPSARDHHTAVWTGREMIVWGGSASAWTKSGGAYDPATDTWRATRGDATAPEARYYHTAVWTGTRMIVWGGYGPGTWTNTGGVYDPATDTWTATRADATAPEARSIHTAVWTGREMIVWGGLLPPPYRTTNSGGRYDPATDTWTPTPVDGAIPAARYRHSAVWTGNEMIVWGGTIANVANITNSGEVYAPAADSWRATSTLFAPAPRYGHTAVWTGEEMIVWGGGTDVPQSVTNLSSGGRYDPSVDSWRATRDDATTPRARAGHSAVWTGSLMIVWGGTNSSNSSSGYGEDTGGAYCVALPPADSDGDDIPDSLDNCPNLPNPAQTNSDQDFLGDACDNCVTVTNSNQQDTDQDLLGDACDNCPYVINPSQENRDGDYWGDACDNCVMVPNLQQEDADQDGVGDVCDNCPVVSNANQADGDADGIGDVCDNCLTVFNPSQADQDADASGDACDPCPTLPNVAVCDPRVISACVELSSPAGKGSGTIAWRTEFETDLRGFNVVGIDAQGRRSQVNAALIPCEQCVTAVGAGYVFVVPKHKSGRSLFIESVHLDGAVDLFGPADRGCPH